MLHNHHMSEKVVAVQFAHDGLITEAQAKALIKQAASSNCGKHWSAPPLNALRFQLGR